MQIEVVTDGELVVPRTKQRYPHETILHIPLTEGEGCVVVKTLLYRSPLTIISLEDVSLGGNWRRKETISVPSTFPQLDIFLAWMYPERRKSYYIKKKVQELPNDIWKHFARLAAA